MRGKYLKDIMDVDEVIGYEAFNIIKAGTGAGKTTFAIEAVAKEFGPDKTLYLIDTRRGKQQLLNKDECKDVYMERDIAPYFEEEELRAIIDSKVTVMTYAQFGYAVRQNRDFVKQFECIICDEVHNLINYIRWDNAKGLTDQANSLNHLAMDMIFLAMYFEWAIVVCLSATPEKFIDYFTVRKDEDGAEYYVKCDFIRVIEPEEEVRHYETKKIRKYCSLHLLLSQIPADQRGLIYVPHIKEIKRQVEYMNSRGIKAVGIWSENNEKNPMSKEQKDVSNYIVAHAAIPDDVQVLFINKSCETSININTPLDYVIVHSSEEDVRIQARGRLRNDLDILYVFDECGDAEIVLDEKWLNRPLAKDDKNALCNELGIRVNGRLLKWTSVKGILERENGYRIETKHTKNGDYDTITR